jgi:death-on-curing protein
MDEPAWVLDEVVPAIHQRQLAEHGGSGGIRDAGLLASALAKPKQFFSYGGDEATLYRLAAAYAAGIIRNHPFIDGNKRTAFVVSMLFLRLNGIEIHASQTQKYVMFLSVAEGKTDELMLANWFESNSRRA